MSDPTYLVDGQHVHDLATVQAQAVLQRAHSERVRPLCMCTMAGVPMYTARHGDAILIKRFPDTATAHESGCGSYLPPAHLSGLGQAMTSGAITINDDATALRLGFSMSQRGGGRAPEPSDGDPGDSVTAAEPKLGLRAVLDYLWQEAGLTTWSPNMRGRRGWGVVSYHLRRAADPLTVRGAPLGRRLFIPPVFDVDRKSALAARRVTAWRAARKTPGKTTQLMLIVGEVKSIDPSRFGHQIKVKHLPDAPLMVDAALHAQLVKRFADQLELWDADPDGHLMMIGTFFVTPTGLASMVEISLAVVDQRWLPYDTEPERLLINVAADEGRRFAKTLRYNLPRKATIASLVLTDTTPLTVCYLLPDDTTVVDEEHPGGSTTATWSWRLTEDMPVLPAPAYTSRGSS